MDLTAAALGALTGLVLAFTGAGGGILAIPLLVLGLHLPVQQAGPVGLAAMGMASALGALVGLKGRIVRYRAASLIGATGMLAAPLGVAIAQLVPSRPLTGPAPGATTRAQDPPGAPSASFRLGRQAGGRADAGKGA